MSHAYFAAASCSAREISSVADGGTVNPLHLAVHTSVRTGPSLCAVIVLPLQSFEEVDLADRLAVVLHHSVPGCRSWDPSGA
jgi:hypothetical protein